MRTVFLLTAILSFLAIAHESSAQIEALKGRLRQNIFTTTVDVPDGKILEIVDFFTTEPRNQSAGTPGLVAVLELTPAQFQLKLAQARPWNSVISGFRTTKIAGPIQFRIRAEEGSDVEFFFYYRILDNTADSSSGAVQTANAVVIPEDAAGDVEIILESSKDLVNWNPANPGTYNSAREERFFRVRAVVKAAGG